MLNCMTICVNVTISTLIIWLSTIYMHLRLCVCVCVCVCIIKKYNVHGPLGRNYVQVYLNEGIEMENENERRKIRKNCLII